MVIVEDDLNNDQVIQLLEEHLADMYATSPPESVHALNLAALKHPNIIFYSAWDGETLLGCVAIKKLHQQQAELKSMRTPSHMRGKGIGKALLQHALEQCKIKGYQQLSLETGTQDFFKPARTLYEQFGFAYCGPFSDYVEDVNSCFMTLTL